MSVVQKVRVSVYATHTDVAELALHVISPAATEIWLLAPAGTPTTGSSWGSSTQSPMTFDDDAADFWYDGTPPYAGSYKPSAFQALSGLIGETAEGVWSIRVSDNTSGGDTGTLQAATLYLTVGGVETAYSVGAAPAAVPDWTEQGGDGILLLSFDGAGGPPVAVPPIRADDGVLGAAYEIRVTPLFFGVAGYPEADAQGLTVVQEADTTLISQFSDLEVVHELNEGRNGRVTISMHAAELAGLDLQAFEQALWVGYYRPGETVAEGIFYGQCSVIDDWTNGLVHLVAQDPFAGKAHSHYIRRGDEALNVDKGRGRLPAHVASVEQILDAARNTPAQQIRGIPGLAMADTAVGGNPTDPADAAVIDFERGQEVAGLITQITDAINGPDMDSRPSTVFPAPNFGTLNFHWPPGDPVAPGEFELGRNLDPVNPDAPTANEVIFNYLFGPADVALERTNLTGAFRAPEHATTHAHVLDASQAYRETRADAASSALIGAWVSWTQMDATIKRPTPTAAADTTALIQMAAGIVKAYGKPPAFLTVEMRADDAQVKHYGHPDWSASVPVGVQYIAGKWYIGDYVRIRASRGHRAMSMLARIAKVTFTQAGSDGLPYVQLELLPAIGGTDGDNDDEPGQSVVGGVPPTPEAEVPGGGEPPATGTLLFEDTFDGSGSIDSATWSAYDSPGHSDNGLRRPSQLARVNNQLVITAHWNGTNIVSGGMAHKTNYLYGTFIVRVRTEADPSMQLSGVALTWPQSENWPYDGELDWYETGRFELDRTPFRSYLHWQGADDGGDQTGLTHEADAREWHIMRMDWTATYIRVYRDGVLAGELTDAAKIPNSPMHVSLQLDAFDNNPLSEDVRMYVDYVSVHAI